ncbi:hypothetical protein HJG60_010192 [Phyllostomus discolor]|uniref:Uncharacterized protein n=1 Tax=Phyllostomus discolor TaxID=89673 RepID=A0A834EJQ9_9CHIR|nr:hypothetical protein HJG60_010192 [Phyllostomus discolor]
MKFYLSPKIAFTSTKVKKVLASSGHTSGKRPVCQAQGKVGKMKQVLNKSTAGNSPPPFVALASTVALKIPSQPVIKRGTAGDRRIILCCGHLEVPGEPGFLPTHCCVSVVETSLGSEISGPKV